MRQTGKSRSIIFLSTILFIIILSVLFGFYMLRPTSYLSLDINPGIELWINRLGNVVSVTPINDDASDLLSDFQIQEHDLASVITQLSEELLSEDYLVEDKQTLILLTFDDSQQSDQWIEAVNAEMTAFFTEHNIDVLVIEQRISIDSQMIDLAHEEDVSAGKLRLIQELVEKNPSLSADQLSEFSIYELFSLVDQSESSQELMIYHFQQDQVDAASSASIQVAENEPLIDAITSATSTTPDTQTVDVTSSATVSVDPQTAPDAASSATKTYDDDEDDYDDDDDDDYDHDDDEDDDDDDEHDDSLELTWYTGSILYRLFIMI